MDPLSTRQRVQRRVDALELERSSWLTHWQDINRVLLPRTGDFLGAQPNQGNRRNTDILDNTATAALTTLQAGMQSGLTSPARPWLKIETVDTDLMNAKSVSLWCDQVTQKLRTIFSRSNTYRALHGVYGGIGAYGTAAAIVLPDFRDVIRFYPLAAGEFSLGVDARGEVNALARKFQMTVGQIVERYVRAPDGSFDWSKVSATVKNLWDRHNVDAWVPVWHLIQPRAERDARRMDAKNMPFESICIEAGASDVGERVLSESGYRRFPANTMRWYVEGQDIYGSNCPGMVALGDITQLQTEQLQKGKGIAYQVEPPVQVPISLKNQDTDLLPGGVTYVDMIGPQSAIRSAFDVPINLQHLREDIADVRQRINTAFYADLFLFLSSIQGLKGQMTAREVAEIHEEKLLMLGPVVENIENALQELVDVTFDAAAEAGVLPPPPPEIEGVDLKVEFIGLLSQAQRAVSMSSVDRIIGATASIAAAKQDQSVWDKIDTDQVIDKAAGYLGVDPEIIRGDDEVEQIRQQRAQAMQAEARAQAAERAAATAKNLAGADMSTNNALTNVVQGFSGVPA